MPSHLREWLDEQQLSYTQTGCVRNPLNVQFRFHIRLTDEFLTQSMVGRLKVFPLALLRVVDVAVLRTSFAHAVNNQ